MANGPRLKWEDSSKAGTKGEKMEKERIITFNITYYPAQKLLSKIHLLLIPNEEHRKVFFDIPTVGFKRGKSAGKTA